MTLVEDYSTEAVAEIIRVLKERVRRMHDCQISDTTIRKLISDRFGVSAAAAKYLKVYVIDYLCNTGVLSIWDVKPIKTIYSVNKAALTRIVS